MRANRLVLTVVVACAMSPVSPAAETYRLYDGVTAYVPNPDGKDFTLKLDVRDLNLLETGPREVLVKIYDPAGKAVVRAVIPDDGVVSKSFLPVAGAWDHEAWYYEHCRMQGTEPMVRWSAFSSPDRLNAVPKRTFSYPIKGGGKGIYRVVIVGFPDHYVTMSLDPDLKFGVCGHPTWLHGSSPASPRMSEAIPGGKDATSKKYIYVPRATTGIYLMLAEFDTPHSRRFTLSGPGLTFYSGTCEDGLVIKQFSFDKLGLDDKILTLDVGSGGNDFLVNVKFLRNRDPEVAHRGVPAIPAIFAPDEAIAKTIQGGAIYHDDRVFWQPFQVRLHEWFKKVPAEELMVKKDGQALALTKGKNGDQHFASLATHPGFLNVNAIYWVPPKCDGIMHHYQANKNRQALNVAIQDLYHALRCIGPSETPAVGGPWANMGYEYSNYAWQYWRPAWRILQQSDAPAELKDIVRDAFLVCGDRLAFCVTWARTNGNAFAQTVAALRYCQEATGDPLQKQLGDTYFDRFANGGWGERSGIGKSGACQEGFGYDHHYGSYAVDTWKTIIADLDDPRFKKVHDRMSMVYAYTLSEELSASPWCSRTHHVPPHRPQKDGPYAWKGLPGPDFTESVNGGNEWFAARRQNYYMLTYHGRITPAFVGNAFAGQIGYSGGTICQLHVPGKGLVLASTLNGSYGEGMALHQWRNFHLHSLVGQTTDGKPFVAANSEHEDARFSQGAVISSGHVRESPFHVGRYYEFGDKGIHCTVRLRKARGELLNLWIPNKERGNIAECYEMIPFLPNKKGPAKKGAKGGNATSLTLSLKGKEIGALTNDPVQADTIVIDRGGFGVRIVFTTPCPMKRGQNNTLLIDVLALREGPDLFLEYRLEPF